MGTALNMSEDEYRVYLEATKKRMGKKQDIFQGELRERLMERVKRAAEHLKRKYGVKKVVLFGSLAHGALFDEFSDIDIAVEGIGEAEYWLAWKDIEEIVRDYAVDLVDILTASDSLKRYIKEKGIEI